MTNAEKFYKIFGMYATELWAMPEEKFLEWLNYEQKQTNADRIRSMTDEELAEWIADDLIEPGYDTREQTVKMWLDWLKEEAGE